MEKKSLIKKIFSKRNLPIIIIIIGILLLITAAGILIGQISESKQAEMTAEEILSEYIDNAGQTDFEPNQSEYSAIFEGMENELTAESVQSKYSVQGILEIPRLSLKLPVLNKCTYPLMKKSVCAFWGTAPEAGPGNFCITGHNYKSGAHFGRLDSLSIGDKVLYTDGGGELRTYEIYSMTEVEPEDTEVLYDAPYDYVLTLVTCTDTGNKRLIVKCKLV